MHSTDAPARPGHEARWPWLIFAVALAVRAIELWELEGSALLEFVLGDAKNYVAWGLDIASGNWLGDETFYQAPLYPYFLGTLFSIFGEDLFAVRIFQLFVGAASCALLSLAGWRFFSKSAGIAAGFMLAIYAPAFYADAMIQKSVLDIFLVCMSLWLLSVISTRLDGRACLGLGLALGTMMLSRENALVFPFVLVPWLLLRDGRSRRQRSTMVALFLTGISLVLFPVALRNWVVGGEFHLTTSQFGHNLYIGNNPAADGTYAPLLPGRGDPRIERQDAIDLAESALGRTLTPSEVSGFYTERALRYIREDPIDWLALMSRKVALVFTSIEMVDTEDQYTHAESSVVLQGLYRDPGRLLRLRALPPAPGSVPRAVCRSGGHEGKDLSHGVVQGGHRAEPARRLRCCRVLQLADRGQAVHALGHSLQSGQRTGRGGSCRRSHR